MKSTRFVLLVLLWSGLVLLAAPAAAHAQADLLITEFLAANNSDLIVDEDGDSSDYFEVFNAGATTVNVGGWFATDDAFELTKFPLPAVDIPPGGFLLVWASGKDRRDPARPIHANFRLSSDEAFLGIVAPDGFTVVHSYLPYPPQVPGFSYGLSMNGSEMALVGENAPCRALVPTSSAADRDGSGRDWRTPDFDDSSWRTGTTGVGYDESTDYNALINLDVEAQMNNEQTSCYVRIPFNVPAGTALSGFNLRMKYDDGFIAYVNGTRLGSKNAPATGAWDSNATGLHDDNLAVLYEDVPQEGQPTLREGTNVLAIHGLNDNVGSSDFVVLPTLDGFGVGELDRDTVRFFQTPSPGFSNLQGFPGISEQPRISPANPVFTGSTQVTLSVTDGSTEIRYTTDGSEPTQSSSRYTGSFSVTQSTMVRARGFRSGYSPSVIASMGYIHVSSEARGFTSDIPVVIIDTFSTREIPDNGWQTCFMALWEPGTDGRTRLTDPPTIVTRGGIRRRGSSTVSRPKASFAFEAWDEQDEDKNIEPLGMPREADWIFYGAYNFDRARMRNPLIYELSNQVGAYATRSKFVEMFVHSRNGNVPTWDGRVDYNGGATGSGMGDYFGVYSFMEKIERDRNRVDVKKLSPAHDQEPEVTGGYMLKVDRGDPGDSGFSAGGQGSIRWVYPKEENVTNAQSLWLRNYINTMSQNLSGPSYDQYIDIDQWINHHILNVLAMNVDALRLSAYMYKEREGLFAYGPIWDFDRSMGSTDGRDDNPRQLNGTGDSSRFFDDSRFPWWRQVFGPVAASGWPQPNTRDPWQFWKDRWFELRQRELSTLNINFTIDWFESIIREAIVRDHRRWSQTPNITTETNVLRSWLSQRVSYIDSQFRTPPSFNRQGGPIDPGFELTMSAPTGTIYYTLDGTDPRASAGGIAGTAYGGPITLEENARVIARARVSNSDWSAPRVGIFVVETPKIVVTEIMYHPVLPTPDSPFSDDDYEFIEVQNIGNEAIDLRGARLEGGIEFEFGDFVSGGGSVLLPGEFVVVAENLEAFDALYGLDGVLVAGQYRGNLDNSGDHVVLLGPLGEPIHDFRYSDLWYPDTDGMGSSLNIIEPGSPLNTWPLEESWAPSTDLGGSPGTEDGGVSNLGGRQLVGDSNQDGMLDFSDGFSLVLRLFGEGGPPALPCEGAMDEGGNATVFDLNEDGGVDLSDVTFLLNYLVGIGPEPAAGASCQRVPGCSNQCFF